MPKKTNIGILRVFILNRDNTYDSLAKNTI